MIEFKFAALSPQEQSQRIEKEFHRLQAVDAATNRESAFGTSVVNSRKNRYADVFANERTLFPPQPTPWYINGNVIDLSVPHRYVACQAPTPDAIEDFWNVVAAHRVPAVFMLTREIERIRKADRYWPDDVGKPFLFRGGEVHMNEFHADNALGLITRHLTVTLATGATRTQHHLQHVQYIGWPDHGVPDSTEAFHSLLQRMDAVDPQFPVIVHCSAGIGRTGTLIGAHAAMCLLREKRLTDSTIFELVRAMKQMRHGMVQRPEQYQFIYACIMAQLRSLRIT
jgi:protein tyrosine phosphatase